MTDPQQPSGLKDFISGVIPWLGLAAVVAGVGGLYTWWHAALVGGAYILVDGWYAHWIISRAPPPAPDGTSR